MPVDENWMLRALLGGAAPPPAAPLPPRPLPPIAPPLPPAALLGVQQAFPGLNPMLVPPAGMPGVLAGVDQLRGMTPPAPPPALPTPGLANNALMQALVGGIVPGVAPLPRPTDDPSQATLPPFFQQKPPMTLEEEQAQRYREHLAGVEEGGRLIRETVPLDPLGRVAGPIGQTAATVGNTVLDIAALPFEQGTRRIGGEIIYRLAKGDDDFLAAIPFRMDDRIAQAIPDSERQKIIDLYEQGGWEAVWEGWIAKQAEGLPWWGQLAYGLFNQVALDPSTWLVGPFAKLGKGMMKAGELLRTTRGASTGAKAAGVAMTGTGAILRSPTVLDDALAGVGRVTKMAFGHYVKPSHGQLLRDAADEATEALHRWRRVRPDAGRGPLVTAAGEPPPPKPGPVTPQLQPGPLGTSPMGPFPARGPDLGPVPTPSRTPGTPYGTPALPRYATEPTLPVTPAGDVIPDPARAMPPQVGPLHVERPADLPLALPSGVETIPVARERGILMVGEERSVRVTKNGKVWTVQEKGPNGRWRQLGTEASEERAIHRARSVVRTRTGPMPMRPSASAATPTTPPPPAQQTLPEPTLRTPEPEPVTVAPEPEAPTATVPEPTIPSPEPVAPDIGPPVYPTRNLGHLDPRYQSRTGVPRAQPRIVDVVAEDVGRRNPEAARGFWDEYEPKAEAHRQRVRQIERETGAGPGYDPPAKVLEEVRHVAEDVIPAFRRQIGPEPDYAFRYGDELDPRARPIVDPVTGKHKKPVNGKNPLTGERIAQPNLANVIERAVFGPDDDTARQAREWLRQNGIRNVADETKRLRRGLYGEEAVAPSPHARGAKAGQADVGMAAGGIPDAVSYVRGVRDEIRQIIDQARRAGVPVDVEALPDASPVGAAFNLGRIDQTTYDALNRKAAAQRDGDVFIPLWELHDRLRTAGMSELDATREVVRRHLDYAFPRATPKERAAAAKATARALRAAGKTADTIMSAQREAILYNGARGIAGMVGDTLYDTWNNLVHGDIVAAGRGLSPLSWIRSFRAVRGSDEALRTLPGAEWLERIGAAIPDYAMPPIGRDEVARQGETLWHRGFEATIGRPFGKRGGWLTGPIASRLYRDFRTALDTTRRWALHTATMERGFAEKKWAFAEQVRRRAVARKQDPQVWLAKLAELGEDFSPEDVLRAFNDDRLARDWRAGIRALENEAKATVHQRLFSYRRTNVDEALRYLLFFHYWQSRALWNHARVTARNPWLLHAYASLWSAAAEEAEANDYPASITGFMRFMGDREGFFSLFDPAGIIAPFTMFRDMAEANGEGGVFDRYVRRLVFVNPLLEAAGTAFGLIHGRFAPDPSGTWAVRRAIIATINLGRAHGIDFFGPMGPVKDPVDAYLGKIYETASGFFDDVLPGAAQNLYPEPGDFDRVAINGAIEAEAVSRWGPRETWTEAQWEQLRDAENAIAMGNAANNELAAAGFQAWADAQATHRAALAVIPGRASLRHGPTLERSAIAAGGWDTLRETGEMTPEQEAAHRAKDYAEASGPAARDLGGQADAYRSLGTERQQDLAAGWRLIAYGTLAEMDPNAAFIIGNEMINPQDLARMSEDERRALADQWVASKSGTEELAKLRDEQDAFRAEPDNSAYASYEHFRDTGYDFPGGIPAYRAALMEGSAAYRAYIGRLAPETRRDPAKLDKASVSEAAYLALAGEKASVYDAELPGGSSGALLQIGLAAMTGGSGGKKEPASKLAQLKEDLASFEIKERAYDLAFARETGGTPRDQLAPWLIEPTERRLELRGVEKPSRSKIVSTYLAWKDAMLASNPNADVTPAAYIRMMEEYARSQEAAA